ncbi:MAG: asparaginase [Thiomonas sp.]|uniref:asparaginase n=1 Tax=Thiomonas sp. TaxID=2047785 RepID=UPI002A3718A5|nr:asparaginase [Thiomonas sp.]MDY0329702.1 asparaginase [Thiomonas sp.]
MSSSFSRPDLPQIVVLGTGGTIAGVAKGDPSLPGYTAGVLGVDALLQSVPALGRLARIHTEQVANLDSKDMSFAVWTQLAERAAFWLAQPQIQACVITHGTDTLEETAYFLHLVLSRKRRAAPSFLDPLGGPDANAAGLGALSRKRRAAPSFLDPLGGRVGEPTLGALDTDKPVILTAAMRPATALNADGPQNLLDAVRVAVHPQARGLGVVCVLHGMVHAARDVTKANTHKVEAFSSGERGPLGEVDGEDLRLWRQPVPEVGAPFAVPAADAWPRVELLTHVAGSDGAVVRCLVSSEAVQPRVAGLVVAGTGGGTMHRELEAALHWAQRQGIRVRVASRVGPVRGGADDGLNAAKLRVRLLLELAASKTAQGEGKAAPTEAAE